MDKLNHWRYFLALEREFCDTLRYVEFTEEHQSVFSFEFARLLILACSELDVVLKVAYDSVQHTSAADSIGKYLSCLNSKYDIKTEKVLIDRFSKTIVPFKKWSQTTPPNWWTAQNKVKHRRHKNFNQATLKNALLALCGLFVANLVVLNEFGILESIHETPTLLGRETEPDALLLESSFCVNLKDA